MKFFKQQACAALCAVATLATLALASGSQAAGTAVPLGVAGDFAVLAGSGITNTGSTTIVGDTGTSPTNTETGFAACPAADCVTQTGTNHVDPADSAPAAAKAALTNAYDSAAGQTPTTIPTELAGQVLPPGVYASASGTFGMSGTVTLDGGDDENAVFIFQTADGTGTLITGGTGNVSLIGRAQSCNVFWKVGTSATLGAGSTFRGTIMAHTSISLGAAVTVDGRLLAGEQASGAGAVTLINDTIIKPTCVTTTPPPEETPPPDVSTTPEVVPPAESTPSPASTIESTSPPVPPASTIESTPTPAPTPITSTPTATTVPRTPLAVASKAATAKTVAAKAAAAAKAKAAAAKKAKATATKKAATPKVAKTPLKKATTTNGSTSTSTSTSTGSAKPPLHRAGFTG